MFRRGNPFVREWEETSSTRGASHLRTGLSLSWPSQVHIQPILLKSCQRRIFLALVLCFLQPFHCNEIMIIDLFLFALLSFVWFVLTGCSPLVI